MDQSISVRPIAHIRNERMHPQDDHWGSVVSEIILNPDIPQEALNGIDAFSHIEVIFYFHKVMEDQIVTGSAHPRGNPDLPKVGIFSQRKKSRPNRLGSTIVKVISVNEGTIRVIGLDAINATPVLDIKPVMSAFLPRDPVEEPQWVSHVMKHYWN